jgi:hypothetical protein
LTVNLAAVMISSSLAEDARAHSLLGVADH